VERLLSKFIGEDIKVTTSLTTEEPVITADSTQIEQILMNLATNARDAMPDGGTLLLKTQVVEIDEYSRQTLNLEKAGHYALLTVSDSGSGIDAKTKEKIFEPFFTTKEVGKGTGLGLAIIYGIVKQHEGSITVYSKPGHGTSFHIYLPIHGPRTDAQKPEEMLSQNRKLFGSGETVLIAEDEYQVRKTLQNILEEFNYSVIEAKDGRDALEKYSRNREAIQLVILDVIMPEMNGKEAYDEIKKLTPDVKVIFTSGYTADVIERKKVIDGEALLMSKPITPAHLLLKIQELLNGSPEP
jgi:CheY-like chemotaxis protein